MSRPPVTAPMAPSANAVAGEPSASHASFRAPQASVARCRSGGRSDRCRFPGNREIIRDFSTNPRKTQVYDSALAAKSATWRPNSLSAAVGKKFVPAREKNRQMRTKAGKSNFPRQRFPTAPPRSSMASSESKQIFAAGPQVCAGAVVVTFHTSQRIARARR